MFLQAGVATSQRQEQAVLLADQLAQAQQQIAHLQQVQQVQQYAAALLGYELRTQFTTILGSSELLKSQLAGPLNSKQDRLVEQIGATGQSIFQMVSAVLEYQQIQAGVLVLNHTQVAVAPVCREVLSRITHLAAAKQQKVRFACEPETLTWWGDQQRLPTMLDGLLCQAMHCAPVGGTIELAVRAGARSCAAFEVAYQGPSLCADEQVLLFEPFVAADYMRLLPAPARASPGAPAGMTSIDCIHGSRRLGVVLARDLAELHGGSLSFESRSGQGGNFTLTLPGAAPAA